MLGLRNNLVLELDNTMRLAKTFSLIGDGKNPDKFKQDTLNGCIAKNQITKGKTDSFKPCEGIYLRNWTSHFLVKWKLTGRYAHHLQLRVWNSSHSLFSFTASDAIVELLYV